MARAEHHVARRVRRGRRHPQRRLGARGRRRRLRRALDPRRRGAVRLLDVAGRQSAALRHPDRREQGHPPRRARARRLPALPPLRRQRILSRVRRQPRDPPPAVADPPAGDHRPRAHAALRPARPAPLLSPVVRREDSSQLSPRDRVPRGPVHGGGSRGDGRRGERDARRALGEASRRAPRHRLGVPAVPGRTRAVR